MNIKWTKTIQRAQDATSITLPSVPGRAFCPVAALDAMILASPTSHRRAPLFMTRQGRPLSLALLKKAWRDTLIGVRLPHEHISLHSLRSGGATAVWVTGKVSEMDVMKHGTWTSSAWKGYVRPPIQGSTVTKAFQHLSK